MGNEETIQLFVSGRFSYIQLQGYDFSLLATYFCFLISAVKIAEIDYTS